MVFARGSTTKIKWSIAIRAWSFTRSQGTLTEWIGYIIGDNDPKIENSSLPNVAIEKPATLILKHVNTNYSGTYGFGIIVGSGQESIFEVVVFIGSK